MILTTQREVGNKWTQISKLLPGRSDNDVKNRFHTLMNRVQTKIKNDRKFLSAPNPPESLAPLSSIVCFKSESESDSQSISSDMKTSSDVFSSNSESSNGDYACVNNVLTNEMDYFDCFPSFSFFSQPGDYSNSLDREQLF